MGGNDPCCGSVCGPCCTRRCTTWSASASSRPGRRSRGSARDIPAPCVVLRTASCQAKWTWCVDALCALCVGCRRGAAAWMRSAFVVARCCCSGSSGACVLGLGRGWDDVCTLASPACHFRKWMGVCVLLRLSRLLPGSCARRVVALHIRTSTYIAHDPTWDGDVVASAWLVQHGERGGCCSLTTAWPCSPLCCATDLCVV